MVMSKSRQQREQDRFVELSSGETATRTVGFDGLITEEHDFIALTYVTTGNGVGEIETSTYKIGGVSGTIVAVLTLTYDSNDKIATVTRT